MRSTHFPFLQVSIVTLLTIMVALSARSVFAPPSGPATVHLRDLTPADGARVPARPVRIGATVEAEGDLQRVSLRVNDREVQPTLDQRNPRRWLLTYQMPPPEEEQKVVLTARDRFGRQRTQTWSFRVDPTISAPTFGGFQPPDRGYAPAGGARIAAVVKSDAPISSVSLQIDGRTQTTTMEPAGSGGVTVATRAVLAPGTYRAVLTAVDGEGDRGIGEWRFTVPDPKELLAFEATGKAIGGGFRTFWQQHGGLPIFGLPISDEIREGSLTVQYFERARFEYHAGQGDLTSEVKLGLIGSDVRKPDPPRPPREGEGSRYFQETGHTVAGPFLKYWEERGGLALFGLPITDEAREGSITVQYFERARFELHPGGGGQTVLLGHIGRELYERRYGAGSATRPGP